MFDAPALNRRRLLLGMASASAAGAAITVASAAPVAIVSVTVFIENGERGWIFTARARIVALSDGPPTSELSSFVFYIAPIQLGLACLQTHEQHCSQHCARLAYRYVG